MMSKTEAQFRFSEDEFGKRFDRCVTDALIKGSSGFLIGSVFSLLFLKRRVWPTLVATGFGVGVAYRACEKDLNS
ncbi:MICOS complex subunit MIC10-like [Teleopsis dalmanni]|uniref:MICOS complex subunit MIC10-like n=1 Tax=Teleopsis dalmanni TaxID=139649 RepID=UPI0018CFD49E|nr:MICOS complex subunit MIC10-like [Teleopsis dalmanni]